MSTRALDFVKSNLLSPVIRCGVRKNGSVFYRLQDGNRFILSRLEFEHLTRFCDRTGFRIRLKQ
jgi:hypothetical protein